MRITLRRYTSTISMLTIMDASGKRASARAYAQWKGISAAKMMALAQQMESVLTIELVTLLTNRQHCWFLIAS